jgi:trimeric autotransporter adhesin
VLTNTPTQATVTVRKITTGAFGGPFTFTQTNLASTPANLSTTAIGAPGAVSSAAINATAFNTQVQLTEGVNASFTLASATCTDTNSAVSGNPASFGSLSGSTVTVPAANVIAAANIVCTFTNAARAPTITLTKSLASRIAAADQFTITSSSGATATSSGATTGNVANFNFTGTAGTAYVLNEAMAAGSTSVLAQYAQTVNCANTLTTGTAVSGLTTVPINITPAAGDIISCTITNTPRLTTLQLAKAWGANPIATDVASIGPTTGGATNTAAFTSNGGVATNSGAPVTIAAGNTIGLPAETFSSGNIANYTTALSCVTNLGATANAVSSTNGQVANTLVVGAGDTGKNLTCTYVNTRRSTLLRLTKTWDAASIVGNIAAIGPTTGLTNNTSIFYSTANTSASSTDVVVYAGEQAILPAETLSVGTLTNYLTPLSCNAGTLVGTNGQATGNTLTITSAAVATNPIICTYANARIIASLTIAKTAAYSPTPVVRNQIVTYTYKVLNNGNVPITNVRVNDLHGPAAVLIALGAGGITNETLSIPGPSGAGASPDSTANDGIWSTLAPGAEVTFTYSHTVTQAEFDNG